VDPEIVVTVFIANGGEGSSAAAPVAAKILQAYFDVVQEAPAAEPTVAPAAEPTAAPTPTP
jgi:cell division protein FtsI/penicillin-binding protein 2